MENLCLNCHKELQKKNRKFCSKSCANGFLSRLRGLKNNPWKYENRYCENCNHQLTGNQKRFCSHSCHFKFYYKNEITAKEKTRRSKLMKSRWRNKSIRKKYCQAFKKRKPWNKGLTNCYTEKTIKKMSENNTDRNPMKGKNHSALTKKKMRISAIKYIQKSGYISPRMGLNEKILLDKQEQIDRCKILRQYHIQDLGYFVDGYCPETNTVYEVYEIFHENTKIRDQNRQQELQKLLKCRFKIIYDKENIGNRS